MDRYKDAVYGTAYAHVGDFHEAQDLSQEAFILAYRRLRSLRVLERFPNWLHAIVRNLCHDHVRARREARTLEEARPADPCDPAEEHSRRAVHRHVRRAVASLSEPHREAASLYYIDGYTCDQVAGFLGVPEGTVKRLLHEARNRLRKEMIHMVRDLFQDNRLPPSFRRVVVEGLSGKAGSGGFHLHIRDSRRRGFPLPITVSQSGWIAGRLKQDPTPRPIYYDTFHRVCSAFGIGLDAAAITGAESGYRGDVAFTRGRRSVSLEADPGDAAALALWFDAPIYADHDLLSELGGESREPLEELEKRPSVLSIDEDTPWALVRTAGGKVEKATVLLHVWGPPGAEPVGRAPSQHARVRRLGHARSLRPVRVVSAEPGDEGWYVWLATSNRSGRYVIVCMGEYEARAIASVLPESVGGGPAPEAAPKGHGIHGLLTEVLHAFDIACERVVVDLLHGTTFYALASFHRGKTVKRIDMRPSDAIALALRHRASILVHQDVVDRASTDANAFRAWQEESRLSPAERKRRRTVDGRVQRPYPLRMGGTVHFSVKSRRKFVWESGDPSIASITADGVVRGLKAGGVALTAKWKGKSSGRSARPRRARTKEEG